MTVIHFKIGFSVFLGVHAKRVTTQYAEVEQRVDL
jgi:hypothetical protein